MLFYLRLWALHKIYHFIYPYIKKDFEGKDDVLQLEPGPL